MATKCEKSRKKTERLRRMHEEYLRQAAVKKEFQAALLRVLDALELTDLYYKLPLKAQNRILFARMRSVRLELAEGSKPSRRLLQQIRFYLSTLLKHFKAPLLLGYREVTLDDFCIAAMTLYFYANITPGVKYSDDELLFKRKLKPYVENFFKNDSPPLLQIDIVLTAIGTIFSRVSQSMYHLKMNLFSEGSGLELKISFSAILHRQKAVTRNFVISGKSRPAYKVGGPIPRRGFRWTTIPSGTLGCDSPLGVLPLEVYIQSHALIRIRERMNTIDHGEMEIVLSYSLENCKKVVKYKQCLLIPSIFYNAKIGYYLVEVIEGIALIKTFLFITNTGTPEGDELDKELNAGKIEKEFLKLDRISTYVNSDLPEDPRIRSIFEKVGLGYLCNLDRKTYSLSKNVEKGYALDFIKYMNLDRSEW